MNDAFVMRVGDRFVAKECGCAFVVDSGPEDVFEVKQAPQCCCGHSMVKQGNTARQEADDRLSAGSLGGPQIAIA